MSKIINIKVIAIVLLFAVFCWYYNEPLRQCSLSVDYPCSPWVMPSLMTSPFFLSVFYFGIMYSNSDIPFLQYNSMYELIRVGRLKWTLRKFGVILSRCLFLIFAVFVFSILTLLPNLEIGLNWGKLLNSIAMGKVELPETLYYEFSYDTINDFSPLEITSYTAIITLLVSFMLCLLMFLLCLTVGRLVSIMASCVWVVIILLVLNVHKALAYNIALFTPSIWPMAANVSTSSVGYKLLPPIEYMTGVSIIVDIILASAIMFVIRRVDMDFVKEDI